MEKAHPKCISKPFISMEIFEKNWRSVPVSYYPTWLLASYMRQEVRLGNTKAEPLQEKCYFLYIRHFEATKRFLEALKTAGDS